ncbi:hydroxymethylbilane synthase [Marinilabilia salmonicolor]|uniref:hydroxymethylbilane synthase n=1 Tax=Marinilabilia salmonicolor TaxID=989 RepID=UPI00029ACE5F|nr:hydroxymethylbilane synthase [Marinilabilia salmonicolor]
MIKNKINIGTRSSQLAMWQAEAVRKALLETFPDTQVEIVPINTKGDAVLDVALSKIGDKGLFTKEIEHALLDGTVDVAVHSLKDLPTLLPEGLRLGGVLPRGEVRDVLVSCDGRGLNELTSADKIGTSSLRRQAQLLHFNPHLQVVDIRGNVNTRLRKMQEGHCDAMIMAGAGFIRLGLEERITEFLPVEIMLPAVSQGAVAMEIRDNDPEMAEIINQITDPETLLTTTAERAFLTTIEGGCQVPVACYSEVKEQGITLTGLVASLDGRKLLKESVTCSLVDANASAQELAKRLLSAGGREILEQIR